MTFKTKDTKTLYFLPHPKQTLLTNPYAKINPIRKTKLITSQKRKMGYIRAWHITRPSDAPLNEL